MAIVAVTGSGAVGWHPLDRRTWSGSSQAFFSLLQERGALFRAFGVEAPLLHKWYFMGRNVHPDRKRWRKQFYSDPAYREALTRAVRRQLRSEDMNHDVMQIGAMFSTPQAVQGRTRCFTFMDSNVAVSLRSPYAPKGLSVRRIDRILEYERRVYNSMTMLFTAGDYLRDSLISDFGVSPDRITVLGMGINLPRIPDYQQRKPYDTHELLFVGADFNRKGGATLLKAFKLVRERYPDAKLHIVGPRTLKVPPGLATGVVHHGHLLKTNPQEWARLQDLFRQCSIFVLPSLYEPFGIAPLEAMAYQMPAVVSDIQALREFVTPGRTGELVEAGNVDALAAALTGLLSDPEQLQRMGDTARQMVLARYTWPAVVDRFLSVAGGTPLPAGACVRDEGRHSGPKVSSGASPQRGKDHGSHLTPSAGAYNVR